MGLAGGVGGVFAGAFAETFPTRAVDAEEDGEAELDTPTRPPAEEEEGEGGEGEGVCVGGERAVGGREGSLMVARPLRPLPPPSIVW